MSTINVENGKTIDELIGASGIVGKDSKFLVSVDGVMQYITLSDLRKSCVGDKDQESKSEMFYSCQTIDSKLSALENAINSGTEIPVQEFSNMIEVLRTQVDAEITSIKSDIKSIKDYLQI